MNWQKLTDEIFSTINFKIVIRLRTKQSAVRVLPKMSILSIEMYAEL